MKMKIKRFNGKITKWGVVFLLLCLLAVTSISIPNAKAQGGYDPTAQTQTLIYNEARTVYLGNLERRDNGVPPLRWNRQLTDAARWFSWDSTENHPTGFCGHQDTLGRWPGDRALAFGYLGSAGAENAYCAYLSPEDAIRGWMDSSPHRANLLDPNSREIGLGYYRRDSDGQGYVTQNFGNDAAYAPVIIENEAISTTSPNVNLYIYDRLTGVGFIGLSPATQMMVSNNASFSGAVWEPYSANKAWALIGGSGWRKVSVKTRDIFNRTMMSSDAIYLGGDVPLNELGAAQMSTTQSQVTLYNLDGGTLPQVQFSLGWLADDTHGSFGKLWGNGERVNDAAAWGGTAYRLYPGDGESFAWVYDTTFIKDIPLVAYFRLKVSDNTSSSEVARISIQGGGTEYAPSSLKGTDFAGPNQYQEFALNFTFSPTSQDPFLIFKFWRSGSADFYVDVVSIFSAPQAITSPLTWSVPGNNYRGQGVWVRYTNGSQFSDISEADIMLPSVPAVSSIVRSDHNPTGENSVNFTATFSEDVSGVDTSDFTLTVSGVIGATITKLTPDSGTTYTVTVNTGSGNGTIRLDVPVSATITDLDGDPLSNLPYTSGETYTINKTFTNCANQSQIPTAECNALVALYNGTNGASWTNNTDWLETTTPCTWYGVTCASGISVTGLNLAGNNLIGTIPPELGGLANLRVLELGSNQLNGSIPIQLGSLTNLTRLSLTGNQLSGSIPSQLGSLTNLTVLGLGSNQLTGSIPSQLGSLTNLIGLFLGDNQLTGSIPSQLGSLTNLTGLYLENNQLSGSIPAGIGNLSQLKWLSLDGNQLTGSIPVELGNLTNLVTLWLTNNQLDSSIPSQLGNLTNLDELHLNNNQLTGLIPPQLGNLSNLTSLTLNNNQLTGPIPPHLGNLSNLTSLTLNNNQLTGLIPSQLGNLTKLTWQRLDNNQLTGSIPSQLGNLTNLTLLRLDNNQLTGSIPSQLGNLVNLRELRLNNNQLGNSIPTELGNLTNLQFLYLDTNLIRGEFPASIINLTDLTTFTFDCRITSTDPAVIIFIDALSPGWQNKICPVVSSVTRGSPSPTSSASVNFTVTFSESVTGVNTTTPFNDFSLTTTGVTGASITGVSGSDATYTVTVNTGSGNGTIRLGVLDDNTIVDTSGNPLGGPSMGDGNFTTGEIYTVIKLVTISGNAGGAGVTLTYVVNGATKTVLSDQRGNYSLTVPIDWSGNVKPSKQCRGRGSLTRCYFSPVKRIYTNVTSNRTNQNYVMRRIY